IQGQISTIGPVLAVVPPQGNTQGYCWSFASARLLHEVEHLADPLDARPLDEGPHLAARHGQDAEINCRSRGSCPRLSTPWPASSCPPWPASSCPRWPAGPCSSGARVRSADSRSSPR